MSRSAPPKNTRSLSLEAPRSKLNLKEFFETFEWEVFFIVIGLPIFVGVVWGFWKGLVLFLILRYILS